MEFSTGDVTRFAAYQRALAFKQEIDTRREAAAATGDSYIHHQPGVNSGPERVGADHYQRTVWERNGAEPYMQVETFQTFPDGLLYTREVPQSDGSKLGTSLRVNRDGTLTYDENYRIGDDG